MKIHFYGRKRKSFFPKVNYCSKTREEKVKKKTERFMTVAQSMCVLHKVHAKGILKKKSYLCSN